MGFRNTIIFWPIPPFLTWDTHLLEFKSQYYDTSRVSYAERLSIAVEKVLRATNSKKVILVTHSMGGLVARSYIRWFGGEDKVYKLLTIGAPNHGIADDNRASLEAFTNPNKWQCGGEYIEMSSRKNFMNKSYADWLNEGWSQFCVSHNIRYATIAGNFNPCPSVLRIGTDSDGVIDSGSVFLDGAEFNAKGDIAHTDKYLLNNQSLPRENSMFHSIYVSEIMKRWIFEDRIHKDGNLTYFIMGPNPFKKNIILEYELQGNDVCGTILLYNINGDLIYRNSFPLFPGYGAAWNNVLLDFGDLSNGFYLAKCYFYDMNGKFSEKTFKLLRMDDAGTEDIAKISLPHNLCFITANTSIKIPISSNKPNTFYRYKLNDNEWTAFSAGSEIVLNGLSEGINNMYIQGFNQGIGLGENVLQYSWIINKGYTEVPKNVYLNYKTFNNGENIFIRALESVYINNITTNVGSTLNVDAGFSIMLESETKLKRGSETRLRVK